MLRRLASAAQPSDLMRCASRETLRDAVFVCTTPLFTPRMHLGLAQRRSAAARRVLSPPAIAVSTFFTKVRMREMRAPLISVRRSARRMRFSADV